MGERRSPVKSHWHWGELHVELEDLKTCLLDGCCVARLLPSCSLHRSPSSVCQVLLYVLLSSNTHIHARTHAHAATLEFAGRPLHLLQQGTGQHAAHSNTARLNASWLAPLAPERRSVPVGAIVATSSTLSPSSHHSRPASRPFPLHHLVVDALVDCGPSFSHASLVWVSTT
jgi:hypothetical protein